ncbi:MAG: tol-pal system-associated acyl-CoA thioesterase [Hahellaceae bacterium]|nr:tol-pal system-associated acyl-CoA thioesterase [Hahellaceae bacterium]
MPDRETELFQWPVRVYIEDTDAGGIVFYANYLRFMERARTEFIRDLGFPRIETVDESAMFVVHSLNIRYLSSACLDDELMVTANVVKVGKTYLDFEQQVWCGERLLTDAQVRVACLNRLNRRPSALPDSLSHRIRARLRESKIS